MTESAKGWLPKMQAGKVVASSGQVEGSAEELWPTVSLEAVVRCTSEPTAVLTGRMGASREFSLHPALSSIVLFNFPPSEALWLPRLSSRVPPRPSETLTFY